MVVAAFVMMTIFLCLALNANSFIYSDDRSEPLSIGIVMSADSKTAQMADNTISDMDTHHVYSQNFQTRIQPFQGSLTETCSL